MSLEPPRPITKSDNLKQFDCGKKSLNDWLLDNATRSEAKGAARTYLLCDGPVVVGYYCLSNGAVARDSHSKVFKGLPRSVPAILIGRLAIHKDHQRKGIGTQLAMDAFDRAVKVAELSGTVAIFLHVDEQSALNFWMTLGFQSSLESPQIVEATERHSIELYLPIETARKALTQSR